MTVKQPKRSTGFTLLEILIAMLIVSIGLLGVATLQIRGQQFNQVSYFRTQATFLAYDLMDRIRVNFAMNGANMASYAVEKLPLDSIDSLDLSCDETDTLPSCDSATLRDYDLKNWLYYLNKTLPGKIVETPPEIKPLADGNGYEITIHWKNIVDGKGSTTEESPKWELRL